MANGRVSSYTSGWFDKKADPGWCDGWQRLYPLEPSSSCGSTAMQEGMRQEQKDEVEDKEEERD